MTVDNTDPSRPPEQIAIGIIQDAEAYRKAAVMVDTANEGSHPRFFAPTYFLLCHSAELALKAFLTTHRMPARDLQKVEIRHNLRALYEAALAYGLKVPVEKDGYDEFGDLMDWLSPFHKAHAFRYRQPGYVQLPSPAFMADRLEPVIADIAGIVRTRWVATRNKG
jgi:hypothetical protein